ncbi:hypothetical protein OUZ56_004143 [Daphnia magna]|uniref:Uncharacterized protein n=1 Tax=Daphnia magna TaxID=35525 RepID=A0ABQ9YP10_9CRUS|nr:hypothetical protein OUZ56_004143 [Daphnia magna]
MDVDGSKERAYTNNKGIYFSSWPYLAYVLVFLPPTSSFASNGQYSASRWTVVEDQTDGVGSIRLDRKGRANVCQLQCPSVSVLDNYTCKMDGEERADFDPPKSSVATAVHIEQVSKMRRCNKKPLETSRQPVDTRSIVF